MTLAEFKALYNVTSLNFYKSNVAGSNRHVAGFLDGTTECTVVTTKDFSPGQPAFVYRNSSTANEDGVVIDNKNLFWITNKEQKEAAFTM